MSILLESADAFAVLAGTAIINTETTLITIGDLGVYPGSIISGFPPGILSTGIIHNADNEAHLAHTDLIAAYNSAINLPCGTNLSGQDLGTLYLSPGIYCFDNDAFLNGNLTLDASGNPDGQFIFKIGSTLITSSDSIVVLLNEAQSCNIFWQVGDSAILNINTQFNGSILALNSITSNRNTVVNGRLLAINGSVILDNNEITAGFCTFIPPITFPIIIKSSSASTVSVGQQFTYILTVKNTLPDDPLTNIVLTDILPSNVSFISGSLSDEAAGGTISISGNTVTVNLEFIAPNTTINAILTVQANVTGTAFNLFNFVSSEFQTITSNIIRTIISTVPSAPIISKSTSATMAVIGQQFTYTLTVNNNQSGSVLLNNVILIDILPSNLTFVSGSTRVSSIGNTVTVNITSIAAGAIANATIIVRANTNGVVSNSFNLTSPQFPFHPISNTVTTIIFMVSINLCITPDKIVIRCKDSCKNHPNKLCKKICDYVTLTATIINENSQTIIFDITGPDNFSITVPVINNVAKLLLNLRKFLSGTYTVIARDINNNIISLPGSFSLKNSCNT